MSVQYSSAPIALHCHPKFCQDSELLIMGVGDIEVKLKVLKMYPSHFVSKTLNSKFVGTFHGSRPSLSSLWKLLYYDHRLGDKYWKVGGFTKKSPMRFG